jgi:type I restriction enzyme S subunit
MGSHSVKLEALCDAENTFVRTGPFGSQLHESDYSSDGIPVIMPKDIANGKIVTTSIARVSENHVARLRRHKVLPGDIVYGRRGDIGRQALVRKNEEGWLCGTGCLLIRINKKQAQPLYMHYYLSQQSLVDYVASQAIGATMPNLNTSILLNIPISLPSLPIQRKLAAVLSAYDDLIENNNRRIAILEKMAEELYREWFVRLRFPGHEKVKVVKGVPEGWEVKKISEVVDRKGFGRIYRETELQAEGSVVVIDQSVNECLGYYDGEPEHRATKDSPIILFGDHSCKMLLMIEQFSLAENVVPVIARGNMPTAFLFYLIHNSVETTEYKRHWTELVNKKVFVPHEKLQKTFADNVMPLFLQTKQLRTANGKAKAVRDRLLSRLMSGKIDVVKMDIWFPASMQQEVMASA